MPGWRMTRQRGNRAPQDLGSGITRPADCSAIGYQLQLSITNYRLVHRGLSDELSAVTGGRLVTRHFTREGDDPRPHMLPIPGSSTGYSCPLMVRYDVDSGHFKHAVLTDSRLVFGRRHGRRFRREHFLWQRCFALLVD